jgi:translation initiation factor eIF-2B subunit delta
MSMSNAIRWLKREITLIDIDLPDSVAMNQLCEAIDSFIYERVTVAGQAISERAMEKIRNGDTILTFAKSSIVQTVLLKAKAEGKQFKVIVLDDKPLFEGRNLAACLERASIPVQYELFTGLYYHMKDTTKVFLGAHSMLGNGNLKSRAGTAQIAMAAKELGVPVIVCCESVKFSQQINLNSLEDNELGKFLQFRCNIMISGSKMYHYSHLRKPTLA